MSPEDYVSKRTQLQREIELLRPVEQDDLIEAADMLENFATYWDECDNVDNPLEARSQLMAKIVDRVFVYDDQVIAIALHGDFGVVLGEEMAMPEDILEAVRDEIKKGDNTSENVITQCGSDGHGSLTGCRIWVPKDGLYHVAIQHIFYAPTTKATIEII